MRLLLLLSWLLFLTLFKAALGKQITCKVNKLKIAKSRCSISLKVNQETEKVNLRSSKISCKGRKFKVNKRVVMSKSKGCEHLTFIANIQYNKKKAKLTKVIVSTTASGATTGKVTSPKYPKKYPKNKDVTTSITGPEGTVIRIVFDDFNLENQDYYYGNCYDWVTVSYIISNLSISATLLPPDQ